MMLLNGRLHLLMTALAVLFHSTANNITWLGFRVNVFEAVLIVALMQTFPVSWSHLRSV